MVPLGVLESFRDCTIGGSAMTLPPFGTLICSHCGRQFHNRVPYETHFIMDDSVRRCLSDDEMLKRGMRLSGTFWLGSAGRPGNERRDT
jgi:hypothetical protein